MDYETPPSIPKTPFDNIVSPYTLDIMKLMLPYIKPNSQRMFAIFIKLQELTQTIEYFEHFPKKIFHNELDNQPLDFTDMISEMRPYLPGNSNSMFDTLANMMEMMEMMKTMQDFNSDETGDSTSSDFNNFDFLKAMLPPEQQEMVDMLQKSSTEFEPDTE